jgi:hypothetical protein
MYHYCETKGHSEHECEVQNIMFKITDLDSKFQNLSNKHQA